MYELQPEVRMGKGKLAMTKTGQSDASGIFLCPR